MSYMPAVISSLTDQPTAPQRLSRLPQRDHGATFLRLLIESLQLGTAVIDEGGKTEPTGMVVAHWLAGWEAMPIYPTAAYALVQQVASARGIVLGNAEQVWSDLEQAGLLTRAWNGHPLTVRWRGVEHEAFIIPLVALSFISQ